jgi:hypothetical protein
MAWNDARADLRRAQGDGSHVLYAGIARGATRTGAAPRVAASEQLDEFSAQGASRHGVDGAVDGLVRHGEGAYVAGPGAVELQTAGELFGRPARAKAAVDVAPCR